MPEVQGTFDKIDAGHWLSNAGGSVMFAVVVLCIFGLASPWWTRSEENLSTKELIEVSLWTRYARMEFVTTGDALDCSTQCDITNLGSSTVREIKDQWSTTCRDATDDLASVCSQLWVMRVCILASFCFALLYSASAVLAFYGSGKPAACRFPAACSIILSLGCVLLIAVMLIVAGGLDVKVTPPSPGSELQLNSAPSKSVDMNGVGFICTLVAIFVSVLGLGLACLNQSVMDSLSTYWEFENGRPMADTNRGEAPNNGTPIPPTLKLNTWTTEPIPHQIP